MESAEGVTESWPCPDDPVVTYDDWGEGFFVSYCDSCHAASATDRHGAPTMVHFDSYEEVAAQADLIENSVLVAATMPPGGGIVDEDLERLEIFLRCAL